MEMEVIVEESEEEKAMNADKKLRNDLEKTEAAIWENRHRNPIKVKNADGELQDRSDAKKARKETLEDQVFKVLLKTSSMDEKAVEKLMWTYIVSENIDSLKFLDLCGIGDVPENEDTREKVEGLTIKVLVNMFCAPTQKFGPTQFKADLKADVGIKATDVHKIYSGLTMLMELATSPTPSEKSSTDNITGASANKKKRKSNSSDNDSSPSSTESASGQLVSPPSTDGPADLINLTSSSSTRSTVLPPPTQEEELVNLTSPTAPASGNNLPHALLAGMKNGACATIAEI